MLEASAIMLLKGKHKCRGVKNVALGGEGLRGRASPPFYFYAVAARADVAFKVNRKKNLTPALHAATCSCSRTRQNVLVPLQSALLFIRKSVFVQVAT